MGGDVTRPTIGMLGGGQLGRYALMAARSLGMRTVVLEPDPHAPAAEVADVHLAAAYDDGPALSRLGGLCDVVTTEFENPPVSSMAILEELTTLRPRAGAIAIAQDRRKEKAFLTDAGLPIGPHASIDGRDDFAAAVEAVTFPAVLKTARLGYDGKGQVAVRTAAELDAAFAALGSVPCVLEQRLDLDGELSVVVARGLDGALAAFDVAENLHRDGILDLTVVPARIAPGLHAEAIELATEIASRLAFVGVLGVELFVVGGALFVNELAPRPHNSGHWTLDAARTSQFEQQVRAVCGFGLGSPDRSAPAVAMVNLLGDEWFAGGGDRAVEPSWEAALAWPQAHLHLYGKRVARHGRKMGHLTVIGDTADEAAERAVALRQLVRIGH